MKIGYLLLLFFVSSGFCHFKTLDPLRPQVPSATQVIAVTDLLKRIIPKYVDQFVIKVKTVTTSESGYVVVENGASGKIQITGNSGVDVAFGIQRYLRDCCNAHFSWDGNTLNLTDKLPPVKNRTILQSLGQFRYFSNVCTFSYSFVWWAWPQWESFIDWLALNGFNLPLSHVGQEAVWVKVWKKFNLTDAEIAEHFTGPAFLAWNRMGNIQAWAGPLPQTWLDDQMALQKQILKRMVSLGMIPVLPAFPGHVPRGLKNHFPHANISKVGCWSNFHINYTCLDFLEPTDPLFQTIGSTYMKQLHSDYGLYHAYSADSFNEMEPKTYNHSYLTSVSQAIFKGMSQMDTQAVWVMQAWLFLSGQWLKDDNAKALLAGVPTGKLLLLDLCSERVPIYNKVQSYYGQPYIWNMLHNFGGVSEMRGSATVVNKGLTTAMKFPNSTLVGTGLTMEGIYQNYPIYQFMIDRSWTKSQINTTQWISAFANQRYGMVDSVMQKAWSLIWSTIYEQPLAEQYQDITDRSSTVHKSGKSLLFLRPTLKAIPGVWYDTKTVCSAWKLFIEQAPNHTKNNLFKKDLVDLTREILQLIGSIKYYNNTINAFHKKDIQFVASNGTALLTLLGDMDSALATHQHFMLGAWISLAKIKGKNVTAIEKQYEYNARNQITLWGPNGEILDYARKEWSGVVSDYYKPRWSMFLNALQSALREKQPFNNTLFVREVFKHVEKPFTFKQDKFPNKPKEDPIKICKGIYDKYIDTCMKM